MPGRELNYFLAGLMFYTRVPCPGWFEHKEEFLQKSRKYFPLIGWIVAGVAILTFLCLQTVLPASVTLLVSMAATIFATGAFHEDGFADSCDAFGGGWGRKQILTIMKDSRIGTYGTVGLGMLLAIKFATLYEIQQVSTELLLVSLINGHTVSRFLASAFVQSHDYVQDLDRSKVKPVATYRLSVGEMSYSAVFVLLPLFLFAPQWWLLLAVVPAYLSKVLLAAYFSRHIGGYTGDCLGATQQLSEVVFYLSLLSLCTFI